jgi:hypothetical protein
VPGRNETTIKAKKTAQQSFLKIYLKNEGIWWTEFYRCIERRKNNTKDISVVKDVNGQFITDSIEKLTL